MAFALHLVPSKARTSSVSTLPSPQPRDWETVKTFQFKRNDQLPIRDHALWRIHSGYVRTFTWGPEGDTIPLGFWSMGDIVGPAIAQISPYEVQCLNAVIAEPLAANYAFSREAVLAQVQQSNELLRIVHCRQAEQRLMQFLCWLAQRFGEPTKDGLSVPVKLIHQDIAESIGATRVTITRLLKKLEREGKIQWSVHRKVVSKVALAQFILDTDCQIKL